MRALRTDGKYFLYRIDGHLELWRGRHGSEWAYRAGYVSDAQNFEYAVEMADEEMRCLMAEAGGA